jgi:hypothetical protein
MYPSCQAGLKHALVGMALYIEFYLAGAYQIDRIGLSEERGIAQCDAPPLQRTWRQDVPENSICPGNCARPEKKCQQGDADHVSGPSPPPEPGKADPR